MYTVQTHRQDARPAVELVRMTPALRPAVVAAAAEDGHAVIHPTHAVLRGNEIVGYGSLGAVPMFFAWLDTHKLSGPESFRAWAAAEKLLVGRGPVCLPCMDDSPLLPFIARKGYVKIGTAHIHLKEF